MKVLVKPDIRQILAENLEALMEARNYSTAQDVSRASALHGEKALAVNTIKNIQNKAAYARLDILEQLAATFGKQVWQLVHPDPEQAARETAMYTKIASDFGKLPPP